MRSWLGATVVILALATGSLRGQSPTTTLTGQVVGDSDGQPLAGARIVVPLRAGESVVAVSDPFGRFQFALASRPRYQLTVSKAGYTRIEVNAAAPGPIVVRLQRAAVVSGRVIDDAGEPIVGAQVSIEQASGSTMFADVYTNDRGEFRAAIPPGGRFIAWVQTNGVGGRAQPPGVVRIAASTHRLFFPATPNRAEATPMVLGAGEVRVVDFVVPVLQSARQPMSLFDVIPTAPLQVTLDASGGTGDGATISGQVVDPAGVGIANALVAITGERGGSPMRSAHSDVVGRFEFTQVADGAVIVAASKPGYRADQARSTVSRNSPPRAPTELRLEPWSAITGRIVDRFGEPLEKAAVRLLRVRYDSGQHRLAVANDRVVLPLSDDRGEYRLYGLEPGRYLVEASLDVGTVTAPELTRTYYPGSARLDGAQFITLAAGEEASAVDVVLSPSLGRRVSGRVVLSSAAPPPQTIALWPRQETSSVVALLIGTALGSDGSFAFRGVPPGQYVLQVSGSRINASTEGQFGALPLTVGDDDVTNITLPATAGSTIAGRLVIDSTNPSVQPSRAQITVSPVPSDFDVNPFSNWATAGIGPDGRFTLGGISGTRRIAVGVPAGWTVKAIRANGADVTDRLLPFGTPDQSLTDVEIVLTDRVSELAGRLADDRGRAIAGIPVIVFAASRDRWYPASRFLRRTSTRDDGQFLVAGLPGGDYYVAAVARVPEDGADAWQDPDFLDVLQRNASFVSILDGERASVRPRMP